MAIPLLVVGGRVGPAIARIAPIAILAHHYVGLRRVFGGSRLQTAWKGTVIWAVYTLLVLSAMVAIGVRTLKEFDR